MISLIPKINEVTFVVTQIKSRNIAADTCIFQQIPLLVINFPTKAYYCKRQDRITKFTKSVTKITTK